jgi:3-deoxy-alpha-D-manno-octulosonate 8-oxidase
MMVRELEFPEHVLFGEGSFDRLGERLARLRTGAGPVVFLLDHYFRDRDLYHRIPSEPGDRIMLADVSHEPGTTQVDEMVTMLKEEYDEIPVVVGIGGGSTLDLAKAVAILLNNPGGAAHYQGWDLVNFPAVYKIGVPTLSGTGAEITRTTVLNGPQQKLGINSDYTPFDEIILDPGLVGSVPHEQRFYSGMDCFIHCVESLEGRKQNEISRHYAEHALQLCREVFSSNGESRLEKDEKLMRASFAGGLGIRHSQVGIVHAMSYGLGYHLGIRHGLANCLVMNKMDEYYPDATLEFRELLNRNGLTLPTGTCRNIDPLTLAAMVTTSLRMRPLWENAMGHDWEKKMPPEKLSALFLSL